jgi:GT2 family glycosyltransferase
LISSLVRAIQFSGADAVTAGLCYFSGDENASPVMTPETTGQIYWGSHQCHSSMFKNLLGDTCGLIKSKVFKQTNGFHEAFGLGLEDWGGYIKLKNAGWKIVGYPEPLFWYRISGNRITSQHNAYRSMKLLNRNFQDALPVEWKYLPQLLVNMELELRRDSIYTSSINHCFKVLGRRVVKKMLKPFQRKRS